jgi:hypothetical protein
MSCMFCMLIPDSDTLWTLSSLSYTHTQWAVLLFCVQVRTSETVWPVNSLTAALRLSRPTDEELINSTVRKISGQCFGLATTSARIPPAFMLQFQVLLMSFLRTLKGYNSSLAGKDLNSPFLGQERMPTSTNCIACGLGNIVGDEFLKLRNSTVCSRYKVVQIWPGLIVCKLVTVCPGHIWTTLYFP